MLAQTTLDVPTDSKDDTLTIPIPEAYLFGQTTFALAIADSGTIVQLQYGSTSGASVDLGGPPGPLFFRTDAGMAQAWRNRPRARRA